MSHDNARELRESIEELKREGTNVILIIEPGRFPGDVLTIDIDSYVESITRLAADLEIEVWDTYHLEWDPAMYADEAHFNRAGTVAFTRHVAFLLDQATSES